MVDWVISSSKKVWLFFRTHVVNFYWQKMLTSCLCVAKNANFIFAGCISGLPRPFCPGLHLCGLLNLPTRPEQERNDYSYRKQEGGRVKSYKKHYGGHKDSFKKHFMGNYNRYQTINKNKKKPNRRKKLYSSQLPWHMVQLPWHMALLVLMYP